MCIRDRTFDIETEQCEKNRVLTLSATGLRATEALKAITRALPEKR